MTLEKAIKIRDFATGYAVEVLSKRKDYGERLTEAIQMILPDGITIDSYNFLNCKNWDSGETNTSCGVGKWLDNLQWDEYTGKNNWLYSTEKGQEDIKTALRVAVELIIDMHTVLS